MVDYSKLSDFEINKRVALAYGKNIKFISVDVDDNDVGIIVGQKHTRQRLPFDPCNNPADAWPIIEKNKIGVRNISGDLWECSSPDGMKADYSSRPLHSSMVVFLMMREEKS